MEDLFNKKDFSNFIVVGDKVLIKPRIPFDKTKSGLYLPPGVLEKEKLYSGYVIKVGPGYPIPIAIDEDEPWKEKNEELQYMSLQAQEGDMAIYLQKGGFEIEFNKERYIIVPHSAIMMLVRDTE